MPPGGGLRHGASARGGELHQRSAPLTPQPIVGGIVRGTGDRTRQRTQVYWRSAPRSPLRRQLGDDRIGDQFAWLHASPR